MELSSIHVYPVKGAAGISLSTCAVTPRGLADDRRFMVVDSHHPNEGRFVTQRDVPRLALVRTALEGDSLVLSAPDLPPLRVPRHPCEGQRRSVTVWRSTVDAIDLAVSQWMTAALHVECSLVYMPDDVHRAVNPEYAKHGEIVSFADGYPFLLATEESLEDLNARIVVNGGSPAPMDRFRANLVVRGATPWAEDDFGDFSVGEAHFSAVKPCDRCVVTTIDQATSVGGKEPLRTLATFRAREGKVFFAQNLLHRSGDVVRKGDCVTLERSRS